MDTNMSNDFGEIAKMVVREEMVLEKFDGEQDDPDKVLRERITLVDGSLVKQEWFDESGNLVETKEV